MSRNSYTKVQLLELMEKAFLCMTESYSDTLKALREAKFHELGSGNYGSAWEHADAKGWVIKVCGRVDGDSYPAYAFWGAANPMPGVPEFKHPTFSPQHDVFMVMLPKYERFDCKAHGYPGDGRFDQDFLTARRACYGRDTDEEGRDINLNRLGPVVQAAFKACEFFGDLVQWDLHSGNFMIDPELDILVMTDPIHCGANDHIIAKVYSREPVKQSWGFQQSLNLRVMPAEVVHRDEFRVLNDGFDAMANLMDQHVEKIARPLPNVHRLRGFRDERRMEMVRQEWDERGNLIREHRVPINGIPRGEIRAFGNPQLQQIPRMDWMGADFAALEQRVEQHRVHGHTRKHQDNRERRLAYWVKENDLKPAQVLELGRLAQGWPDHRVQDDGVRFCLAPEWEPNFLRRNEQIPDRAVNVRHFHASREIVAILRNWWQVEQENRGRVGWGGRFAKQVEQFRNFIR